MTILRRILTTLIMFELIAVAAAVGWRVSRPVPPRADASRMDDDARALLDSLHSQAWSGEVKSWSKLGDAYLGNGFFPEAEACYRYVLQNDPQNITSLYGLALCLSRTGRTSEAIEKFHHFIDVAGPRHADPAWYQIGRCYLREENADQAELALQHVNQMPEAIIQWVHLLIRSGREEEAQRVLDGLLTQFPQSLHVIELAMHSAQQRKRQRDATRFAARLESSAYMFAMSLDVSDIENYRRLAGFGGPESASEQMPGNQSPAAIYDLLARKLEQSRDGRDRRLVLPTAQAALAAGQPQAAIDLLDRHFEHSQVTPQALMTYGDAQVALQRPAEAVRAWQRSLHLLPTADAYRRLVEPGAALVDETQRKDYSALAGYFGGMREFRANRPQAALKELKSAVELKPDHAPSWLYLGKTLLLLNQRREATEAYETCLKLDPDNSDARTAVAALQDSNG
jgi:cytochrome c-type biogenesis protein CcmH/NrfG